MSGAGPGAATVVPTCALVLLVFVVLPGTLYVGNAQEFMTAPVSLALQLLVPAMLLLVTALLALRLGKRRDYSRFTSVTSALTLLAWIQAYLLVWDYGPLDGSPIDWGTATWRRWVDLPLWIAGLAAALGFHRRLATPLATAALAAVALQGGVLALDAFEQRKALALKQVQRAAANDLEAMARFSPDRNVLHIVLDSFQADVFKDIIEGPAGLYVKPALNGFTFFEENLGTFPATYLALPALLSGQVYRNQVPQAEFMESVYAGKSILNAARGAGFEIDLAGDAWMLTLLMKGRFDHAYLTAHASPTGDAARLLDLALFRLAPHVLKPAVYNGQRWRVLPLFARSELLHLPYFTHNAFLAKIAQRLAVDRPTPVYKYFHLMTTHAPFVVEPDCSWAGAVLNRVRETVTAQSQCSLAFVIALLEQMKQAGAYDNSLIVIMGDHGGHIPPHGYQESSFTQGDRTYTVSPAGLGLATPLLAIKPPGVTAPFRTSAALTSSTDVAATIDALLRLGAGLPGDSLMDETRDPAAERRFYGYKWSKMDPVSEYIELIMEYRVTGSAYRIESWHVAGEYPAPVQGSTP